MPMYGQDSSPVRIARGGIDAAWSDVLLCPSPEAPRGLDDAYRNRSIVLAHEAQRDHRADGNALSTRRK
jgi:hypothetical protein